MSVPKAAGSHNERRFVMSQSSMTELIRKLDDVYQTSVQYISVMGYDSYFASCINRAVHEVLDEVVNIDGTPDEWEEIGEKAVSIKRILTQKEIALLNNAYYAS